MLLYFAWNHIIHNVFVTQGSQLIGLAFKAPTANLFTNRWPNNYFFWHLNENLSTPPDHLHQQGCTHFVVSLCVHLLVRASHSLTCISTCAEYLPKLKPSKDTLVCSLSSFCVSLPVRSAYNEGGMTLFCSLCQTDLCCALRQHMTLISHQIREPILSCFFLHIISVILVLWLMNVFMVQQLLFVFISTKVFVLLGTFIFIVIIMIIIQMRIWC